MPWFAQEWKRKAACNDIAHPDIFFPSRTSPHAARIEAEAIAICEQCEVREACLADALKRNEPFGIWGGKTPEERAKIRRRLRGGTNEYYN